jgi:hypothetical protein
LGGGRITRLRGGKSGDETFGPGGLYFLDLSGLPIDPEKVLALIEEREIVGGPPGDWETFVIVGDLLRETHAPPALRATLYEVAANLAGVEYLGKIKVAAGRSGLAVAYTHDGTRQQMIFDPQTAQLLGERRYWWTPVGWALRSMPIPTRGRFCSVPENQERYVLRRVPGL